MSARAIVQIETSDSLAQADVGASPVRDRRFTKVKRQPTSLIFTKFGDVKSRVEWTAEHRKVLQTMWNRGDKAADIAAALGCKVGAVSVARKRFGLKPRSVVPGRPPREPDEPAHKIERVAFTTSRLADYCSEKELVAQTGHESREWLRVSGNAACPVADRALSAAASEPAGIAGRRGVRSGGDLALCRHRAAFIAVARRHALFRGGRYERR